MIRVQPPPGVAQAPTHGTPRACIACPRRAATWGLAYCTLGRWAGIDNEHRCELHPPAPPHTDAKAAG